MTNIEILLQILHFLANLLAISASLFLLFGRSYFSEKGKNLATKEDIEEITKKVERIKTQLNYFTQTKINIKTEERNAVVNCYEKYCAWQTVVIETYTGSIQTGTTSKEIEFKINETKSSFDIAYGRMQLFINNKALTTAFNEATQRTFKLQATTTKHLFIVSTWIGEYDSFMSGAKGSPTDLAQQKLLFEQRENFTNEFLEEKGALSTEVYEKDSELQLEAYNHIQALLQEEQEEAED